MSKNFLISLVGEQTIPNVELIEELKNSITHYVFVYSPQTSDHLKWTIQASGINEDNCIKIMVDAHDPQKMENTLKNYPFEEGQYVLNLTGGTKIMMMVALEFFKKLNATMYYLTGRSMEYLKIHPEMGERKLHLTRRISLAQYLTAYGFSFSKSTPLRDYNQARTILDVFLSYDFNSLLECMEILRNHRDKNLNLSKSPCVKEFTEKAGFKTAKEGVTSKYENRYLSGDWFEEYIYYRIKEEIGLSDDDLWLGCELLRANTKNEFDVIFIFRNKLYIIECKTSVTVYSKISDTRHSERSLLNEIIYKSDALRIKFGLFANSYICTLENLYAEDGKEVLQRFKDAVDRAELSRIGIIQRDELLSGKLFSKILKINHAD